MTHQTTLVPSTFACLAVAFLATTVPETANAIPAFARKYEDSCQTCHSSFPDLTAFGEAFRNNGYRYPAGEDDEATVEDDVALGHEATKKVFPESV